MSDYLKRLAARLLNPPTVIRPRTASRFESAGPMMPGDGGESGAKGEPDGVTIEAGRPPARGRSVETPLALHRESPSETAPASPDSRVRAFAAPADSSMVDEWTAAEPSPRPMVTSPTLTPDASPVTMAAIEVSTRPTAPQAAEERSPAPRSGPRALEPTTVVLSPASRPSAAAADNADSQRRATVPPKGSDIVERPDAPRHAPTPSLAVAQAMRRHDAPAPSHEASPTVVQVTIGTVEVRSPAPPPRPQPAAPRPSLGPRLSLQDYLQRRGPERRS